jgi:hypothetical protein
VNHLAWVDERGDTVAWLDGVAPRKVSEWVRFGNSGVLADNDPAEQEKSLKFNSLLANAVIFHNTVDIADVVRQLQAGGEIIDPGDLAQVSPYLIEYIMRFGEYSTHELALEPEA